MNLKDRNYLERHIRKYYYPSSSSSVSRVLLARDQSKVCSEWVFDGVWQRTGAIMITNLLRL